MAVRVDPNFKGFLKTLKTARTARTRAGVVFSGTVVGAQEAIQKLSAIDRSCHKRIIRKGIRKASRLAAKLSKPYVPDDTKTLRNSFGWRLAKAKPGIKKAVGVVGARRRYVRVVDGRKMVPTNYQHLVDKPTQAHIIQGGKRTTHGKLAFNAFGRRVVVSQVRHPGTRGQNFIRKRESVCRSPCLSVFTSVVTTEIAIQAAKQRPSEVDDG